MLLCIFQAPVKTGKHVCVKQERDKEDTGGCRDSQKCLCKVRSIRCYGMEIKLIEKLILSESYR